MNIEKAAKEAGLKLFLTPTGTDEWHGTTENLQRLIETRGWESVDSCPDKETVLFFCGQFMQVGRMEHNVTRQDGSKRDLFWGWYGADKNPPTHWMPLPKAP